MNIFLDTNVLMDNNFNFNIYNNKKIDKIYISIISIQELDSLKTDKASYNARHAIRNLINNINKICIVFNYNNNDINFKQSHVNSVNDDIIIQQAKNKKCLFLTSDLNVYLKSKSQHIKVQLYKAFKDEYLGYTNIKCNEKTKYDNNGNIILKDVLQNEYVILDNGTDSNKVFVKDKEKLRHLCHKKHFNSNHKIENDYFGELKFKDIYQKMLYDSLINNKMTLIKGKAGSGKSYLAWFYMLQELEKGHIDKIIVFVNPCDARSSQSIGYLPGTLIEKLLGSSLGSMLEGKLNIEKVYEMVENNELVLKPMSSLRGYDTGTQKSICYIHEAQNTNIDLMKLSLQRVNENTQLIIDGDCDTQVDMSSFNGINNGMKRVSEIFRGQSFYGEVSLPNIYRSEIAQIADLM